MEFPESEAESRKKTNWENAPKKAEIRKYALQYIVLYWIGYLSALIISDHYYRFATSISYTISATILPFVIALSYYAANFSMSLYRRRNFAIAFLFVFFVVGIWISSLSELLLVKHIEKGYRDHYQYISSFNPFTGAVCDSSAGKARIMTYAISFIVLNSNTGNIDWDVTSDICKNTKTMAIAPDLQSQLDYIIWIYELPSKKNTYTKEGDYTPAPLTFDIYEDEVCVAIMDWRSKNVFARVGYIGGSAPQSLIVPGFGDIYNAQAPVRYKRKFHDDLHFGPSANAISSFVIEVLSENSDLSK